MLATGSNESKLLVLDLFVFKLDSLVCLQAGLSRLSSSWTLLFVFKLDSLVCLQAGLSCLSSSWTLQMCFSFLPPGIARLMSDSRRDGPHIPWVLPPGISQAQLGGVFKLDWIHK